MQYVCLCVQATRQEKYLINLGFGVEEGEAWEGVACLPLAVKYPHPAGTQSPLKPENQQREGRQRKEEKKASVRERRCACVIFCLCCSGPLTPESMGLLHPANQQKPPQ